MKKIGGIESDDNIEAQKTFAQEMNEMSSTAINIPVNKPTTDELTFPNIYAKDQVVSLVEIERATKFVD